MSKAMHFCGVLVMAFLMGCATTPEQVEIDSAAFSMEENPADDGSAVFSISAPAEASLDFPILQYLCIRAMCEKAVTAGKPSVEIIEALSSFSDAEVENTRRITYAVSCRFAAAPSGKVYRGSYRFHAILDYLSGKTRGFEKTAFSERRVYSGAVLDAKAFLRAPDFTLR